MALFLSPLLTVSSSYSRAQGSGEVSGAAVSAPSAGALAHQQPCFQAGHPCWRRSSNSSRNKKAAHGIWKFLYEKPWCSLLSGFKMQACHFVQGWEAAYEHLAGEPWPFLLLSHCLCTSLPSKGKLTQRFKAFGRDSRPKVIFSGWFLGRPVFAHISSVYQLREFIKFWCRN